MNQVEPLIRDVSDTAHLAAVYRARENERANPLFRDPLAQRLASTRGEEIAAAMPFSDRHAWSWVTRTYLFDQFISEQLEQGIDMVINLAAGLDARPYRLALPSSLTWVEVDLPRILDHKEDVLKTEKPACALERVRLNLADIAGRRELFGQLGRRASKALVISEGLLIYLTEQEVGALAEDLAEPASFERWIIDLVSPGLLRMLQKNMGGPLSQGGAQLQFAPEAGTDFFTPYGWELTEVRGLLKTARGLKRLSLWMHLLSLLPEPKGQPGSRPWSGVCLLTRKSQTEVISAERNATPI